MSKVSPMQDSVVTGDVLSKIKKDPVDDKSS